MEAVVFKGIKTKEIKEEEAVTIIEVVMVHVAEEGPIIDQHVKSARELVI